MKKFEKHQKRVKSCYLAIDETLHSRFLDNSSSGGWFDVIFCQCVDQTWSILSMKFHEIWILTVESDFVFMKFGQS